MLLIITSSECSFQKLIHFTKLLIKGHLALTLHTLVLFCLAIKVSMRKCITYFSSKMKKNFFYLHQLLIKTFFNTLKFTCLLYKTVLLIKTLFFKFVLFLNYCYLLSALFKKRLMAACPNH